MVHQEVSGTANQLLVGAAATRGKMGSSTRDSSDIAAKYADELVTLRVNSKPLINSLTMMAEDYIKQAPIIVQTIERHLNKSRTDVKLPVLYLIDSIIKNVKREYVTLFAQNIVSTFCGVFERADEKTRMQMFKLRQTWVEVFSANKLYQIDVKARSMDPGWPVAKLPPTSSIHVNPKFLKPKSKPEKAESPTTSPKSTGEQVASPSEPSNATGDDDDASMREELLRKQKELIDLQQRKLELELQQIEQAKLKASVRKGKEENDKLLKQAEIAKQRTNMATSIIAKASETKPVPTPTMRSDSPTVREKASNHSAASSSPKVSSSPKEESAAANNSDIGGDPRHIKPRVSHVKAGLQEDLPSTASTLKDVVIKQEKKSPRKNSSCRSDYPSGKEKTKAESKRPKPELFDTKDKDKDSRRSKSRSGDTHSPKDKEHRDKSRHRDSPDRFSKGRSHSRDKSRSKSESSSDSPDKRSRRSRERDQPGSSLRSSKEKDAALDRMETDSGKQSPRKSKDPEDKVSLDHRRSAVLSKSYRKRRDETPERNSKHKKESDSAATGDTDLRFVGLQDVDLRREGADEPSTKKPRRSAFIEDLFGQEDVDLRQAAAGSTWAQVKKPLTNAEGEDPESDAKQKTETPDDIRHILSEVGNRPPPGISPANSVDSNLSTTCDNLGRPLLFSRLPAKPEDRKRELGTRSLSLDAVEQFRSRYLKRQGGPTGQDIKLALAQATNEHNSGALSSEQHNLIMKELVQLNEMDKIRRFQEARNASSVKLNAPSPWGGKQFAYPEAFHLDSLRPSLIFTKLLANNVWAVDDPTNFLARTGGNVARFPAPWGVNQWQTPTLPAPVGPNPFVEAAKAMQGIAPISPEEFLPETNLLELKMAEKNSNASMPLDKVIRNVRFYGDITIVFLGAMGEEPHTISFQPSHLPKIIYINKTPFKCHIGERKQFYLDKKKHIIQIGTPKRELIIDGEPYEACFSNTAIRVSLDGKMNFFALDSPPPQVEIGKQKRYDLVAGRVTLFIDSISTSVYLDELPQVLDLGGVPVIFRFCNDFRSFTLNGRIFPANFGGQPMCVTLRAGRQHFLRLAAVSVATEEAMNIYVRIRKEGIGAESFLGGRGARAGRVRGAGLPRGFPNKGDRFEGRFRSANSSRLEEDPLEMLANIIPTDRKDTSNQNNAYKSDEVATADSSDGSAGPLNVHDLLSKLMMAGLLPTGDKKEKDADKQTEGEVSESNTETPMDTSEPEPKEQEKPVVAGPPPLEVVNVTWNDNMRERRVKLVDQICTGTQCASCGLRFAPDQSLRYTQHLDWHFRLNRREKANTRKAQSRTWYYDLNDWMQFVEAEEMEERAASLFAFQEPEKPEEDDAETSTLLNPDAYTVRASGFEHTQCPQCGEGFETFYDSEEDEWRLRDALAEKDPVGEPRLFHPICHEDYVASLARQAAEAAIESMEDSITEADEPSETIKSEPVPIPEELDVTDSKQKQEDDEDEVMILKEGKKEVVLMEVVLEEDDPIVNSSSSSEAKLDENEKITKENETETEKTNDLNSTIVNTNSRPALSPIVIQVEDDSIIPGITSMQGEGGGVFDFALSSDQQQNQANKQQELPQITYNSMQFDFPKIKEEPLEWNEVDENQVIMSKEFQVNESQTPMDITLEDDSPPPTTQDATTQNVDIDLTAEDEEESSQGARRISMVTAIDGNLEMRNESQAPLMSIPTKIRINISGPEKPAESQSPSHAASSQEDTSSSNTDADPDNVKNAEKDHNEKVLEEIKRLKPRLVGKKLVNCPPKQTGKEESGLCVIC